jgi:predicted DNA-binding transcriptional regulator AlpA
VKNLTLAGYAPLATICRHWKVTSGTARSLLAPSGVRIIRRSGRGFVSWLDIWRLEGLSAPLSEDFDSLRKPLLRRDDVAARYGISQRTALRWMSKGELPTIRLSPRILRLRESDLDRLDDLQLVQDDLA